jgi:hypothetical protein
MDLFQSMSDFIVKSCKGIKSNLSLDKFIDVTACNKRNLENFDFKYFNTDSASFFSSLTLFFPK